MWIKPLAAAVVNIQSSAAGLRQTPAGWEARQGRASEVPVPAGRAVLEGQHYVWVWWVFMLWAERKVVGWHPLAARWNPGSLLITLPRSQQDCQGASGTAVKGAEGEQAVSLQVGKCRMLGSRFASSWFTHSRNKETTWVVSLTLTHQGKKWKHKSFRYLDSHPSTKTKAWQLRLAGPQPSELPICSLHQPCLQPHRRAQALPRLLVCNITSDSFGLAAYCCIFLCEWQREDTTCSPCQPGLTFLEGL